MFAFKQFQAEDLARFSIPDGVIYSGDCGVGKTPMAIGWVLLKVGLHPDAGLTLLPAAPVLIVAPGGLLAQMQADYKLLFGKAMPSVTRLDSINTLCSVLAKSSGRLPPGYFMSSYTELSLNGMQRMGEIIEDTLEENEIRAYTEFFAEEWKPIAAASPQSALAACKELARIASENLDTERIYAGIPWPVRCVYRPALVDLLKDQFAAVVLDEGVHAKAQDSIIGEGARRLSAKYRLILSGTAIKNKLPDIFHLCQWSAGSADRWPHTAESFASEFQVASLDKTLAARAQERPGRPPIRTRSVICNPEGGVPIAEIANTQKLWRTLAPVVLRRRKSDISDCEIVPKTFRTIVVPMGMEQARVYAHHLKAGAYNRRGQPDLMGKIAALRTVAACPCAASLGKVRSAHPFIPKLHATLEVVQSILRRGEQLVIFSPFCDPLDTISRYLTEAMVPHDILDGRLSAKKRALLAANFKRGLPSANPVLLAGIKACSEGFSWHLCNNVLLYSFDFALDLMRQAIDRVHRINSPKPVNVYSVIVAGSIEVRMAAMLEEKGDASDIALDGAPGTFVTEEVRMSDLLKTATDAFTPAGLVDETVAEQKWPALRDSIRNAWAAPFL